MIINTSGLSRLINPFQRQMRLQQDVSCCSTVFEAPLPISSVQSNPELLSTFPGVFHHAWPCMHVVALEGGASTIELASRSWVSLLFVVAGMVSIHQQNKAFSCSAGDCLYLPESPVLWHSSTYNVVCLMFSPQQLTEELKLIRSTDLDWKAPGEWNFSQPACRKASDGDVEASLLSTLRHLLNLTSELAMTHPILFTRLGISNQLCLLTALLASPSLSQPLLCETEKPKNGGAADAINELTSYMIDNLADPLNLTILERYSHYSRRSLQYAFRQKFGCTITQWIRSQRLDKAHARFRSPHDGDTVGSIAKSCGYQSTSLFSIEFQKRFHIKPSVLLRSSQNQTALPEE